MPAQIILFLDRLGILHAEGPGKNGGREKFDLPDDFLTRNPEIRAIFLDLAARERATSPGPSLADLARARDLARETRRAEAKRVEAETKLAHWNSLTREQQDRITEANEKKLASQRARELETAHSVWNRTASKLGVDLANRVIDEPARRPRGAARLTRLIKGQPEAQREARRAKKLDLSKAIDLL